MLHQIAHSTLKLKIILIKQTAVALLQCPSKTGLPPFTSTGTDIAMDSSRVMETPICLDGITTAFAPAMALNFSFSGKKPSARMSGCSGMRQIFFRQAPVSAGCLSAAGTP